MCCHSDLQTQNLLKTIDLKTSNQTPSMIFKSFTVYPSFALPSMPCLSCALRPNMTKSWECGFMLPGLVTRWLLFQTVLFHFIVFILQSPIQAPYLLHSLPGLSTSQQLSLLCSTTTSWTYFLGNVYLIVLFFRGHISIDVYMLPPWDCIIVHVL